MEKFTASEVRERAKTFGAGDIYRMLCAYADRLEADERAVPVASISIHGTPDGHTIPNVSMNQRLPVGYYEVFLCSGLADAERLAEAVRNGLIDALRHQRQIDEDGAEVGVSRQAIDEAAAILSALAAHYAQSQPPAASVTDAKDAARYRWLRLHYDVSASRHGVNDLLAIRLPQESLTHTGSIMDSFVDNAMLAAQENPNG